MQKRALFDRSASDTLFFLIACSCLPEAVKPQPLQTADTSCHLCKACKIRQGFATSRKSLIPLACLATSIMGVSSRILLQFSINIQSIGSSFDSSNAASRISSKIHPENYSLKDLVIFFKKNPCVCLLMKI